jgi:hypothetical protein
MCVSKKELQEGFRKIGKCKYGIMRMSNWGRERE